MPTVNEALRDASIRNAIFLQRYGGSVTKDIIKLLNETDADLVRILGERLDRIKERGLDLGPATTARLQNLQKALQEQIGDLEKAVRGKLVEELRDLAVTSADIAARRLDEAIGVDLTALRVAPELLRAAVTTDFIHGKHLSDWTKDLSQAKLRKLRNQINIGITEGQTTPQIIRRLTGTRVLRFRDGVFNSDRIAAEAVTRTAVNYVGNRARELTYQANADLIKEVQWKSTLDGRTSPICQSRDGMKWPVDEAHPSPPAHPRCRSILIPLTKSWGELAQPGALKSGRGAGNIDNLFEKRLKERGFSPDEIKRIKRGTRASMNGQVPSDLNYNQWLKTQSAEFQDEVLGKTKGRLFRDGGLSVDRFVDSSGSPMTLDELKIKESAAFTRAGIGD